MRRNDTCIPRTFLRKAFAHPSSINFSRYPIAVTVAECSHVLFLLPKGGVQVVRGQVYSIVLNSDHNVFYETRAAAQPISPHQVGDVSKHLPLVRGGKRASGLFGYHCIQSRDLHRVLEDTLTDTLFSVLRVLSTA